MKFMFALFLLLTLPQAKAAEFCTPELTLSIITKDEQKVKTASLHYATTAQQLESRLSAIQEMVEANQELLVAIKGIHAQNTKDTDKAVELLTQGKIDEANTLIAQIELSQKMVEKSINILTNNKQIIELKQAEIGADTKALQEDPCFVALLSLPTETNVAIVDDLTPGAKADVVSSVVNTPSASQD